MLISITILPLVILSFLSLVLGNEFVGLFIGQENLAVELTELDPISFSLDPLLGAIVLVSAVAVAVMLLGLRILGSGLSDDSIRILCVALSYIGIWMFLSVLAMPLLLSIELFGALIYTALTIGYTIGVVEKMSGVG